MGAPVDPGGVRGRLLSGGPAQSTEYTIVWALERRAARPLPVPIIQLAVSRLSSSLRRELSTSRLSPLRCAAGSRLGLALPSAKPARAR